MAMERAYYQFKSQEEKDLTKKALDDLINIQKKKEFPLMSKRNPENEDPLGYCTPRYTMYSMGIEFDLEDPIADSDAVKRNILQDVIVGVPEEEEKEGKWTLILRA